jgi:simple sugar transport system permease protein
VDTATCQEVPLSLDGLPAFGPPRAAATPSRGRRLVAEALARPSLAVLVGLVVVVLVLGAAAPQLLSAGGLTGVLDTAAPLGIGAVAVALLLVAGQFDLSVGVVALSTSVVTATLAAEAGWDAELALVASLVAALLVGLVNGLLVVLTGLPSILVTLASFLVLQGATMLGSGQVVGAGRVDELTTDPQWRLVTTVFGGSWTLLGLTLHAPLLWWLGATVLGGWVLWRTRFGNGVLATGGAPRTARELGVPVSRTVVSLFCVTALAGWLIGTIQLSRFGGVIAPPGLGEQFEYVLVAVIGGCLLTGGYGSVVGASIGALLYAVVRRGIDLAGWDQRWFQVFLGVLLLVALMANGIVRRRLLAVPRS